MEEPFVLNKQDWYESLLVDETGFEPDQYGNLWYSVVFAGDAASHLWLAKERPEANKKYYGHFEKTKSGKKLRFKRDKEPEDSERPTGAVNSSNIQHQKNDGAITLGMVWKTIAGLRGIPESDTEFTKFFEIVKAHTDELLKMSDNIKNDNN